MAIRCDHCNFYGNPDNAEQCAMCGTPLDYPVQLPIQARQEQQGLVGSNSGQMISESPTIHAHERNDHPIQCDIAPQNRAYDTIQGRITHIERNDERLPSGVFKIASKIMIGVLLFLPYIILFLMSLILCFVFGILRFRGLSHLFNPVMWTTMVVELMELIVLRNMRGVNTVPVYRGVVDSRIGREQSFTLIGPLSGANLRTGSEVILIGKWGRGSLFVRSGVDLCSHAAITTSFRNPWPVIFSLMVVLYLSLGMFVLLYVTR